MEKEVKKLQMKKRGKSGLRGDLFSR